ncbi:hypothetical protein PR202_ga07133 [Eleusine coracana subsp. coracana]|uniref:Secreted protein n=1 Tax=Eleusine coracana subsp. coracana TaxID=191504 RepID=A0AAV5BXW3_ELECO|nr:hypothetical protein PR202_ga07133 [Eleusine coracana subsp. coracana]
MVVLLLCGWIFLSDICSSGNQYTWTRFCNFNSIYFCGWSVHVILAGSIYTWPRRVVYKENAICSPYLQRI